MGKLLAAPVTSSWRFNSLPVHVVKQSSYTTIMQSIPHEAMVIMSLHPLSPPSLSTINERKLFRMQPDLDETNIESIRAFS